MATHKATRTRPYLMTAAAVASAAAIVGVVARVRSERESRTRGAPSPNKLVTANYELAALSDITVQGISTRTSSAGADTSAADTPTTPTRTTPRFMVSRLGVSGVSYYLIDNVLDTFTDFNPSTTTTTRSAG